MESEWGRNDPSFGKENEETILVTRGVNCETKGSGRTERDKLTDKLKGKETTQGEFRRLDRQRKIDGSRQLDRNDNRRPYR